MARNPITDDDPLLWQARRTVELALRRVAANHCRRDVQLMETELRNLVAALTARSEELDRELKMSTLRAVAYSAYSRRA